MLIEAYLYKNFEINVILISLFNLLEHSRLLQNEISRVKYILKEFFFFILLLFLFHITTYYILFFHNYIFFYFFILFILKKNRYIWIWIADSYPHI